MHFPNTLAVILDDSVDFSMRILVALFVVLVIMMILLLSFGQLRRYDWVFWWALMIFCVADVSIDFDSMLYWLCPPEKYGSAEPVAKLKEIKPRLSYRVELANEQKRMKEKPNKSAIHLHESACRNLVQKYTANRFRPLYGDQQPATKEWRTADRLPWLCTKEGHYLDLDGWCPELGVAFEYWGPIHQEKRVQLKDQRKAELLKEHNIPLLVVHYRIPDVLVPSYIYYKLESFGCPMNKKYEKPIHISELTMLDLEQCYLQPGACN